MAAIIKKLICFQIFLLVLLSGCSSGKDKPAASSKPNILLISLDTLRADRLGLYGYSRDTSPNLDKLSKKAVIFNNASSTTSWTLPAHVSMLSGLYPSSHKVTQKKGTRISADTALLAEILKSAGYRTFGFANGGYVSSVYGFKRGFEEYPRSGLKGLKNVSEELKKIHDTQGGTGVGLSRAKEKIETLGNKEPFFIFVHTYDIHCPFDPPEPYQTMFITDKRKDIDSSKCVQFEESDKLSKEQVWTLSDRYDGNIRWVDDTLGKFFDWFYTTEASKNTYVIITSDHGEEFFEHNHVDHANSLYKELVHIPFIVIGPDLPPAIYENPVSLVDIVPTVIDLLGRSLPHPVDGVSYASLLRTGKSDKELPAWRFAELDRGKTLRSAYDDKSNMIIEQNEETKAEVNKEYFDHIKDPAEKENKFDLKDEKISKRYGELNEKIKQLSSGKKLTDTGKKDSDKKEEDSPDNLEDLKTLGYF